MGIFLAMGFHALAAQVVLLREMLAVVSGHEVAIGMIMASWLTGILAGAWGATRIKDSIGEPHRQLSWLLGASPVVCMGILLALRHLRSWISGAPGSAMPALGSVLAMTGLLLPQAALVGAMFPLAAAMAAREGGSPMRAIARVYFWEALGSLLGGLALTFVMIPHLHGPGILAWSGMLTCFLSALGFLARNRPGGLWLGLVGACWGVALTGGLVSWIQEWSAQRRWDALHPSIKRITTVDSPYQSVELGEMEGQFTIFGNSRPILSFPDPVEAAPLVHILMHQDPMPKRILLIGGGPASTIPLLLDHPVERILLLELDQAVFETARPFLSPELSRGLEDPRLQVKYLDARFLLPKIPPRSFDAVVIQMGDPSTSLLNRFHTVEFFQALSRILEPDGLLVHAVTGSVNYLGPELERFLGTIHNSLALVCPEVRVIPGERTLFWASKRKGRISLDPETLASRGSLWEQIPRGLFYTWIQPQQVQLWEETLSKSREKPNLDAHPSSIVRFLALWEKLSGSSWGMQLLSSLEQVSWWWIFLTLTVLIMTPLWGKKALTVQRIPLVALGVTGMTAMAQEMVCLYLYQAVWGYLYSRVGLLVGVFMAGLAAGGIWARGMSGKNKGKALGPLLALQGAMTLLCASIAFFWVGQLLPKSALQDPGPGAQMAMCLWMFLAGLVTGASFPLTCAVLDKGLAKAGITAGVASAWDHLGAAVGALLGGVILVPTLGLAKTGLVLTLLQGVVTIALGVYFLAGPWRRG